MADHINRQQGDIQRIKEEIEKAGAIFLVFILMAQCHSVGTRSPVVGSICGTVIALLYGNPGGIGYGICS